MKKWMLFALILAALLSVCCLALADAYVVTSTQPNGYCYLYDQPSSVNGRNLGQYDNGAWIEALDWNADTTYAYVSTCDGQVGYMRKTSLSSVEQCYDIAFVNSTNPNGYCYLYDQPSSVNGTNLGQYNNGEGIIILDWYADENYAKVYTAYDKTGYIRKDCLSFNWEDADENGIIDSEGDPCTVGSTPKGYCYLYDQPTSVGSRNLGRYNDGSVIYVLDFYADDTYAYVQTSDGSTGYMRKAYLTK